MASANSQVGEVLLEARSIKKVYEAEGSGEEAKPPVVLDNINLRSRPASLWRCCGPSGSGKSTLLRVLAGLLRPTTGEVLFKGNAAISAESAPGDCISVVRAFPWLTVLQNVELGLEAQDLPRTQRLKRALAAIDTIGLDGFEDAYPKELSGGMRQRVGFARALVVEPELFFMDEPLARWMC